MRKRQRSVALAASAVVLGCATARQVPRPAGASVNVTTYARLLRMADARRIDTALVREVFRSGTSAERAEAARAVGQVHGRALAGDLRALLTDADTAVAANAAFALGLLHDTSSVAMLTAALEAAPTVGVAAAWALGQIGEPAREPIVYALASPRLPDGLGALLLASAKLRPVPVAAILPHLTDSSAEVRWRATYAIARPAAAAGVRAIVRLAHDPSAAVRAEVARGLVKRATGDSLQREALATLGALAGDTSAHVRVNTVRALATYGDDGRALVIAATHDADANVRIAAAQALGAVLDTARATWVEAWHADTGFTYRASVLAGAAAQGVLLPAVDGAGPDGWSGASEWRRRAAVAAALGEAKSGGEIAERVHALTLSVVRDPDGRVRTAGYEALARGADTAGQEPWRGELLNAGLEDRDPYVRAIAIGALSAHATAAQVPQIAASFERARGDTVPDAMLAAVQFFARAWSRDSANFGQASLTTLRTLPAPADPRLRAAANGVPPLAVWRTAPQAPAAELPPLAWYEERVRTLVLPALAGRLPRAELQTARGSIELELFALDAPLTVDNFLTLARHGYYAHLVFHRVVPNFVVQDGDARGDGNGGPAYTIRDELNRRRYDRGVVGMALSGPDTGGSQYFITLSPQPHLDGGYTVFGRVIAGFGALDAIVQGDSLTAIVAR